VPDNVELVRRNHYEDLGDRVVVANEAGAEVLGEA
jgi:hypothetical protein